MLKKSILTFFLIVNIINIKAQKDTIWFLSGEHLVNVHYSIDVEEGFLTYLDKRNKPQKVGLEMVFSVVDSLNNEKVFFEPTTIGNVYYTVDQMRSFIKGEALARQNYKSVGPLLSGLITGAGSIYFFPMVLNVNVFFSPLLPAANSTVVGTFNYKESKVKKKYPEYSDDPFFVAGYREVVTQKRINNTIKGGLIGLGAGILSVFIMQNVIR